MPAQNPSTLWQLAFRPGFLAAAALAIVAVARWMWWLEMPPLGSTDLPPPWWHAHEMIFGFAMPVVAGFLLSAVATWTGLAGTAGLRLQILFALWLLARLILWFAPTLNHCALIAETAFIALCGYELFIRVWPKRQWRNVVFLPVLATLALLNGCSYAAISEPLFSTQLHYAAVWMITLLVVIIGGRVIPLFSANKMQLKLSPLPKAFEYTVIACSATLGLAVAFPALAASDSFRVYCGFCAALHLWRMGHWQGWRCLSEPLLWSLHLAYLCIPLSLLVLAFLGTDIIAIKNITHLLAIGCIGGMILSMTSRVSLGHTGRPMLAPAGISVAFVMVFSAAIVRSAVPLAVPSASIWAWRVSAVLWIIAFSLFLWRYFPVLTRPRVDGKPG